MFAIPDVILFTLERIRHHILLVFWVMLGLVAATTLALSLVIYVDAVNTELLSSRLEQPPYAFRFRYVGSWEGNITEDEYKSTDFAIDRQFVQTIGLPIRNHMSLAVSLPWRLDLQSDERRFAVGPHSLAIVEGISDKVRIVAGTWPVGSDGRQDNGRQPISSSGQDTMVGVPVLLHERFLFENGLQVGDLVQASFSGLEPIILQVAAFWTPLNADDPRWIFVPSFFEDHVILEPDDFWSALNEAAQPPIEEAAWYIIFDGARLRTADVGTMISGIIDGERNVTTALPGVRMSDTTMLGLRAFNQDVQQLTQQLVIILLPVGGLVLYFVSLVAGLLVARQQAEDIVLRSRGMSRSRLISVYVLMWVILTGVALGIGLLLAPPLVQLIGQTSSFLEFEADNPSLQIVFTQRALLAGAVTGVLAASSGLFMAWRSTGQNINTFRRDAARAQTAWWQRFYLDVMLLIPGVYVYLTLNGEGGLETDAERPFADPLTFVGPTLFALGMTLLFLRLWPLLLRILGYVVSFTSMVALLMSFRELTRSMGRYRGTLLMMCFTLSLTGLTASMASTIDRSLVDSIAYRVGADAIAIMAVDAQAEEQQTEDGQPRLTVTGFNVLPPDDLLDIDGVVNVSRVGKYPMRLLNRNQRVEGVILGVDRAAIAAVTNSRDDFADQSFAEMFNLLALDRSGVLMNRQTALAQNLLVGQQIDIQVSILGTWYDTKVPILGFLDYFPTLDPRTEMFMIGNIEPIFELAGTELPHDFWLSLADGVDLRQLQTDIRAANYPLVQFKDPDSELAVALREPSRRGVLGFLSVGFVAAIVLTLVATIIQNTVAFRAQAVQLGSMRAMGMRSISASIYLIALQGTAALSGILGGTFIGVLTTQLFLPLLDFSGGLPPYLVRVAWAEITTVYVVFAAVLFGVTVITTVVASLEQLSNVVKIGDV